MRRMPGLVIVLAAAAATLPSPVAAQLRYPPAYPGYRYAAPESDLRIAVKPKEADVYVDGYFAGKVESFNVEMDNSSSELLDYFIKKGA